MQFSHVLAILAFTSATVMAAPPTYVPPPPPVQPPRPYVPSPPSYPGQYQPPKPQPPPVNNNQVNTCSSGSPFCCSPSSTGGTTCVSSVGVACNTVSICCNNFANSAQASQSCSGISTFPHPVTFGSYPAYPAPAYPAPASPPY